MSSEILGVTEILHSSRRENRLRDTWIINTRVLRKFFRKQFCFIRCRRQHLWVVEQRRYNRFTFIENTISISPKVPRVKFSELHFRYRRFILFVQTNTLIYMNCDSSISSWTLWRWVRLDLILSMRDKYINSNLNQLTKFTSSSRSTELKISSHGTSLKWSWRPSKSARK